jgi:arginine deiminase
MLEHINYGIEKLGRLKAVMLHRPEKSITRVTQANMEYFLFDRLPDVDGYLEEHCRYRQLLEQNGVTVYELSDLVLRNTELVERLPNLAYLHDIAVISTRGAILSKMASQGRSHEEIPVCEALSSLGIPTLYEPNEGDAFEGCLLLDPDTIFIADTERHNGPSIQRFIRFILNYYGNVVVASIPKARRYMHPDMILGRMTENLAVYYPPAFLSVYLATQTSMTPIDFKEWMRKRKTQLIPLSDEEQQRWGTSFVPVESGLILNYDISLGTQTIRTLEREGVRFIHFHPDALLAGGGSLRCLTLRLLRE